ncbi:hypothetical protein B0T21DRAFT_379239 [Apiosordaria backusii]|uniref:HET-domain-containing protein n=1 Tax=Apiosordaria backusii TaxID=314023 RepID=A0AA39ZP73_9PEZI|nr:hypothetical protein B0T21DRAFT_379239 [Apiosordaria backusii]
MRLLHKNEGKIRLTNDITHNIPAYAILSHTWGNDDEEVTFKDLQDDAEQAKTKLGYRKIEFCAEQASNDGLQYCWVDTCCIDKSNNAELSEAINSMFRWYRNAERCYVYLADVEINTAQDDIGQALQGSRWFTRGWTLQELIAPSSVSFFSLNRQRLGDKNSLEQQLSSITGVPPTALRGDPLDSFSVDERMAWAMKRATKKEEDKAYCLLGIFNIFMAPIYGEGEEHAFYRLNREIRERARISADRALPEGLPILRSSSIFLQERLLIRSDLQSSLSEALSCTGQVRAVLDGLPGIGKTTLARSFAYNAQNTMAILWIPCNSEAAIKEAFEQYAKQIYGSDQTQPESMSLVSRWLSERFPGQWLVIFDGLDAPLINVQQYLFADLEESKILITTRSKDLASYIKATHVFHVDPLDEQLSQELLSLYMNAMSVPESTATAALPMGSSQETEARKCIVRELGGLPLAITIIGAALRHDSGKPSITSAAYLAWSDEAKTILLETDPEFSDYNSSVWKAFQFAFGGILQGAGIHKYTTSMAHFIASCEHASNLAEFIRVYRALKTRSAAPGYSVVGQLRFLETGIFDLAVRALASANMVTINWREDGPDDVPYIEMHFLIRKWLNNTSHDQILAYGGSKMWLLGFAMYEHLNNGRVGASKFGILLNEVSKSLNENPRMLDDGPASASEAIFPLLLDAQAQLSISISHLPVGSAQRSLLHQFSAKLESEISHSYSENLKEIEWVQVYQNWARQLAEEVEYAVGSDAAKGNYTLEDFFLNTLDSHGCVAIAFSCEAPIELYLVGKTEAIEDIESDITAQMASLLVEHLPREAFTQLSLSPSDASHTVSRTWPQRWEKDITEITRICLAEVFIKLQSSADRQRLVTQLPSSQNNAAAVPNKSLGEYLKSLTDSSDPRNAFFAVLRRTVKATTEEFLECCPAREVLMEQKDTFRDVCERAIRNGFGDRAVDAFHSEPPAADAGADTFFSMLWDLAWPARFPENLDDLIASQTFDKISDDLKDAAKQGLINVISNYLNDSSSFSKDLADEVFSDFGISNMFPNWIISGWIDPVSDEEDSEDEEPGYFHLMRESKHWTMAAMRSVFDGHKDGTEGATELQALQSTFECRKTVHNEVMRRLNRPEVDDRTGLGPFFAKMSFKECDKSLRLACLALQHIASEDLAGSLDRMVRIEDAWNFSRHNG